MSNTGVIDTMNLEVTTSCPLHCPQCYCSLTGGKSMNPETADYWIRQGAEMGVKDVMISGGETICYPYLCDVIRDARKYCNGAHIALSGWGFTQQKFDQLVEAGVTNIYISLNGSTDQINSLTRDGYQYAIDALDLLCQNHFDKTTINWVMHNSNAYDFEKVIEIAERYQVADITVMAVKPDSSGQLNTLPTYDQMVYVSNLVKHHVGQTKIFVEACFSPMLALVKDTKLFGNLNVGKAMGCCAGRNTFSVNVDGLLSPCRHLNYFERYDCLQAYWDNSEVLKKIRAVERNKSEPCNSCKYCRNCRHCLAINDNVHGSLNIGFLECPLAAQEEH